MLHDSSWPARPRTGRRGVRQDCPCRKRSDEKEKARRAWILLYTDPVRRASDLAAWRRFLSAGNEPSGHACMSI